MHYRMGAIRCPTCGCGIGHGHHMGGFGMKGKGGMMKMMFKMIPLKIMMHGGELGLSEEQMEAFRNRHAEAKKQMIRIHSEMKINMIDLHNAVMRDEIDMQTAEAKARDIGKLKGDMLVNMIQAMQDMRHILTPDQHKKVREMIMSWFTKGGMPGMETEEGEEEEEESDE